MKRIIISILLLTSLKTFSIAKNLFTNILFVLLVFSNFCFPQNRWEFVNPLPTGFDLHNVNMDSNNKLWVIGEFGTILTSTDKFKTWETIKIDVTENLYDSEIKNEKMWIVGQNGLILYSNDKGQTWIKQNSNTNKSLLKIQFVDANHGWIMAQDSLVLRTTDGGVNWQIIKLNNKWTQNDFLFLNKLDGYLLTGKFVVSLFDYSRWTAGTLLKTRNGGESWSVVDSSDTKYTSIFFLNNQVGYMSIHNEQIGNMFLKTLDAGESWDTLSHSYSWKQISFDDEQNGIAISNDFFGITSDGGLSWEIKETLNPLSPEFTLTKVFSNHEQSYLVGTEGNILESHDFGKNWYSLSTRIDFYYASLRGVTFINKNIGYIYGEQLLEYPNHKPILLSTIDCGVTWNNLSSPDSNSISILKERNGIFLASSDSKLYLSDNNIESWTKILDVSLNGDEGIRDIYLFDYKHFVLLAGRRVYETKDRGVNWSYTTEFGVQSLRQIIIITNNKWIALGVNAITEPNYITENGGETWIEISHNFTTMQFINENIGYALDSALYKTINGGNTWEVINESVTEFSYWTSKLHFYNESIGWLQSSDYIHFTKDGGKTWTKEYNVKDVWSWRGSSMSIISETEAWAVAGNGRIYKLSPNEITSIEPTQNFIPNEFLLSQNYPNPFNPTTKIEFSIPQNGLVKLIIYDILGREVSVPLNSYLAAGIHEITVNSFNLSSGVYFYKLDWKNYSQSKKFIVLK